jgi:hypothetical protein
MLLRLGRAGVGGEKKSFVKRKLGRSSSRSSSARGGKVAASSRRYSRKPWDLVIYY